MLTTIFGEPGTPSPFQYPAGVGVGATAVGGRVWYSVQLAKKARTAAAKNIRKSVRPAIGCAE